MATPIKISTPTDVLEAVPALLGFYPTESIVGLLFEQTQAGLALQLTARMNMPTTGTEVALALLDLNRAAHAAAKAIIVVYTADQDEARALMQLIIPSIAPEKILGTILATLTGWTTVDPDQPDTIQWTNPYPATTSRVAADLAAAGQYPTGTRDDLADSIAAPDEATAADYDLGRSLDPLPDNPNDGQLAEQVEDVRRWITGYLHQPSTVIAEEAAYIARRIRHAQARDLLVELLERPNARTMTAMWQAVAALTPEEDALPVLACLALAAWVAGDGALANVAIDRGRGLGDGPGQHLLALVAQLIERMVPPTAWTDIRGTL